MRSGKLRHLVTIWTPAAPTRTDRGAAVPAWTELDQVYADIKPITAREVQIAHGITPTISHKVEIRATAGIDTRCKFTLGERTFLIHGIVDPEERGREMNLWCTEVTS
jgi:SPP1 family predicted phage head-tail adaptor